MVTVLCSRETVIPIEFRNILHWRAIPRVGQPLFLKDEKNNVRNFLLTKHCHLITPSINKHGLCVRSVTIQLSFPPLVPQDTTIPLLVSLQTLQ